MVIQKEYKIFKLGLSPRKVLPDLYLRECSRICSSLILQQIDTFQDNVIRRQKIGEIYRQELSGIPWLIHQEFSEDYSPAWIQYSVFVDKKMEFYQFMHRNGVDLSLNFLYSVAESFGASNMPNGRKVVDTIIGFPTYPTLTDTKVKAICKLAKQFPG